MYINFQQIRVIRSVKIVHTNILANNRKSQKFARENNTKKNRLTPRNRISFKFEHFSQYHNNIGHAKL